jgi:hypothetical protein
MAATAVYVDITRVPLNDRGGENVRFSNISATTALFGLYGGRYAITCKGATFGTVTLQILAADASTLLTAATAFAANGTSLVDLPPGRYKIAIA